MQLAPGPVVFTPDETFDLADLAPPQLASVGLSDLYDLQAAEDALAAVGNQVYEAQYGQVEELVAEDPGFIADELWLAHIGLDETGNADMEAAAEETDSHVIQAYHVLPAETWTAPPPPFVPPPEYGGLVETGEQIPGGIPGGAGGFPQPAPVPIPWPPPNFQVIPQVRLANTSRNLVGVDFRVGESFRVDVAGRPNLPVQLFGTFNGLEIPLTTLGVTDGAGQFAWFGSMTAGELGVWMETWLVGGQAAEPQLIFTVS